MIIQVRTTHGPVTVDDAEPLTVGGLVGVFAIHPRIMEPRNADSLFDSWVVTHIQTGCAFVRGMRKEDAIKTAETVMAEIGRKKLDEMVSKHPVISAPVPSKQDSLFIE